MTDATNVLDFTAHSKELARQVWLEELAAVQQLSFEMMHQRALDWVRLGDAAEDAAGLLAIISTVPQERAAAA